MLQFNFEYCSQSSQNSSCTIWSDTALLLKTKSLFVSTSILKNPN